MINLDTLEEYIDLLEREEANALPEFLVEILTEVWKKDQEQFKVIFQRTYKKELVELAESGIYKN